MKLIRDRPKIGSEEVRGPPGLFRTRRTVTLVSDVSSRMLTPVSVVRKLFGIRQVPQSWHTIRQIIGNVEN